MIGVKQGDIVKLLYLNESVPNTGKYEIKKGDLGVVQSVNHVKNFFNNGKGYHQIWVKWNNNLTFPLIHEQDAYELIKKVD